MKYTLCDSDIEMRLLNFLKNAEEIESKELSMPTQNVKMHSNDK